MRREISAWWEEHRGELASLRETIPLAAPPFSCRVLAPARGSRRARHGRGAPHRDDRSGDPLKPCSVGASTTTPVLSTCSTTDELEQALSQGFSSLARDQVEDAAVAFERLRGIGISRISKLLALSSEERFGIYDSRVGAGLEDLQSQGRPLIHVPPGRGRRGTTTDFNELANAFALFTCLVRDLAMRARQDGIQILERPADVEMALFMRGGN